MLVYQKYIARNIFIPFALLAVAMTSFTWVAQMLRMLYLIEKGVRIRHFLEIVPLLVPSLLFTLLPIFLVIAVIYSYNNLQNSKELVILRGAGLSNLSIAKPALLVALFTTLFSLILSAYIMPLSNHFLRTRLLDIRNNYVSKVVEPKTFQQISKNLTIYVDKKNDDNSFAGVILFHNRRSGEDVIVSAEQGFFVNDSGLAMLDLINGERQSYDQKGNLTRLYFDNMSVQIQSFIQEDNIDRDVPSSELYLFDILWPDSSIFSAAKQRRMIIDGHQRLLWPLYNYVFTFLALTIFLQFSYSRKTTISPIILSFSAVLIVAYIHFSLQKLSYSNMKFIILDYMQIVCVLIFSLWYASRKKL